MSHEAQSRLSPYTYRTVRWKAHKFFTVITGEGARISAILQDFGEEGVGADLARPLALGQIVELVFPERDAQRGAARFEAKVVRIEEGRHGFLFCDIPDPLLILRTFGPMPKL